MAGQQHPDAIDGGVRELDDVRAVALQGQAALLKARRLNHLLDHPVDLVRLGDEKRKHRSRFWRQVTQRTRFEHCQVALDHSHRPAQLVRGDVQEVGLGSLEGRDLRAQRHTVEARRETRRVLAEAAELFVAEDRGEALGPDDHRAAALLQVEGHDDG